MLEFEKFTLENGLRVVVHQDPSTPLAVVNVLYDVGARDEHPDRTGFAHLFEHLMFGGSVNIPNYDAPLQRVGGENNAFTSNDITNYYLTLPSVNVETGFWLESDRMLSLAFTPKSLEVQRQVVIEEFRQRYLNQPYGDVWLLLRPLVYDLHPYRWPTIGKKVEHIEEATLDDVKAFFYKHYTPANAVLSVAGNVDLEQVKALAEKWFGTIPARVPYERALPIEPKQRGERRMEVERDVPVDALYIAWHMPERNSDEYYVADLLTDILSRGGSSRLLNRLVKENQLFSEISAYVTGDRDPGLLVVSGKMREGVTLEVGEKGVLEEIERLQSDLIPAHELEKVKTKAESTRLFGEMGILNRAMSLAWFEMVGDAGMVNDESGRYEKVSSEHIKAFASEFLTAENRSVLYYRSKS